MPTTNRTGAKATKSKTAFSEADMYPPLRRAFESLGYLMRAEVNQIDATAVKDGRLLLFELKKSFNISLVFQGMRRQSVSPYVYLVVPRQKAKNLAHMKRLVKSLGMGLIFIAMDSPLKTVEIIIDPLETPEQSPPKKTNPRKTAAALREIRARSLDGNSAGSAGGKLLTAFREGSIHIACALYKNGAAAPKDLAALGCPANTAAILKSNPYGWFTRLARGVYFLTDQGFAAVSEGGEFPEVFKYYMEK
ncbi:MAG: DUF2161 family putative PD-(D/E)XK-type phosphodiesterase [Clostridiales bacterium]|jgi:hypothetical protein|nr:DUF2161 family putative PD-(D/E)XK-type phosphodiesterase [Clostridiales bacterium]